jgi:uncharacterized protein (TIGR03083 family)
MTSSLPAETYSMAALLDAWEGSAHAVNELGRRLTPQQWELPTECPGWTTGDIVRHCCWVEAMLAGRPLPEGELDPERFPHAQNAFQKMTELGVEIRREDAQADVCTELDGLIDLRLAQLMALEPLALDTEVMGLMGRPVPLQNMLRTRVFDLWTHEQDIRRATGLPANLASPGAQVSALQMALSTGFVLARNVEAPAGTTLHVRVSGPIAFERWAAVDDDARGVALDSPLGEGEATISLDTDWETYARLGTGRLDVTDEAVRARAVVSGDPELAGRLLEALAITP